ncbi:MAG: M28 family peptidase [bacterium]
MKVSKLFLLLYLSLISLSLFAQEKVDHAIISRIKEEGFQHSQVMEIVSWLSDVYGPRLLGTPAYLEAAEWAKSEMEKWGLQNVRLDPLDNELRGWSAESFSMEMVEPRYTPIFTYPSAWTSSTNGEVSGVPLIIKLDFDFWNPPVDSLQEYHGKLNGKIVFWDRGHKAKPHFEAFTTRFTDDDLKSAEQNINPIPGKSLTPWFYGESITERLSKYAKSYLKYKELAKFFIDENVKALVFASDFDHGILHVDSYYNLFIKIGDIKAIPTFFISNEQFSRIVRMKNKGVKPVLKLHLKTRFYEEEQFRVNVLAEIPGNDKELRQEIVMIGAHFDSWHAGTGATDNGAGSAVMMEAMRILKAIDIKPRRTIRIGLWTGEEQVLLGSMDYAKKNVGDIFTGRERSEQRKISAYFNFDNGSGRIRGIFLQGNEAVRPIFAALLEPFAYLKANTLAIQNTTGTDHLIFDGMNVPAFQFIQDPLNYGTVTHHTNLDVYEYVIEDDLKQSAVIVASLAYHVAMRDEMLPRKSTTR